MPWTCVGEPLNQVGVCIYAYRNAALLPAITSWLIKTVSHWITIKIKTSHADCNVVHRKRNKKQTVTYFPTVHEPRRIPPDPWGYQGPELVANSQQMACQKKNKKFKPACKKVRGIDRENVDYKLYFLVGFIEKRGRLSPNPGLGFRRNSPSSSATLVFWEVGSFKFSVLNSWGLPSTMDLACCISFAGLRKACARTICMKWKAMLQIKLK